MNRATLNRSLAMSYSHMGTPTLPSAQLRFTSEFGMDSGGTTALLSLNKKGTILESFTLSSYKYRFLFVQVTRKYVILHSMYFVSLHTTFVSRKTTWVLYG